MPAEDHDAGPLRHETRDPDHLGIRPGGRQRELPKWQADAFRQYFTDQDGVRRRQQELAAAARLGTERAGDGRIAVADRHRQITEIEIEVIVAVRVGERSALAAGNVDRRCPVQACHPRHGDPHGHVGTRPVPHDAGSMCPPLERVVLGKAQVRQPAAVDHRWVRTHGAHKVGSPAVRQLKP
jgi:hypothetical protein